MATALSLLLLGTVITLFGNVSESITESRSMLEAADRLRLTAERLQLDLAGATAMMNPPGQPGNNSGYFEYCEGSTTISALARNMEVTPDVADTTMGQVGDKLMFTTRSSGQPFVGELNGTLSPILRGRGGMVHSRPHAPSPRAACSAGSCHPRNGKRFLREQWRK